MPKYRIPQFDIDSTGSVTFLLSTTMSTAEGSSGGRTRQRPAQRQQGQCKAWKQGNCRKGNQCKYSHEEQDRSTALVGFLIFDLNADYM